ncbi:MAG: type II toxin-antitoxin system YoeB family toxin, partial [Oscillospiraceae bacterium]|nr:type II toxin-antitoxin system YoeB family toxin [Oscillospiraceae bacterium]
MNKVFSDIAWDDYLYWIENDRKITRKINDLLRDIERNGHGGIGKPEPLKH